MSPPTVILADEEPLFRSALRVALEAEAGCQVVADVDSVDKVLQCMAVQAPDLVVLSIGLTGPGGSAAASSVKAAAAHTRVLVLGRDEDRSVMVAAFETGADGFTTRASGLDDLVQAVGSVLGGHSWVPPHLLGGLLRHLIDRRRQRAEAEERVARLSRREREVLVLLCGGHNHEEISQRLVISPQTVRTHIQNVLTKLEVHSRLAATVVAYEAGLMAA